MAIQTCEIHMMGTNIQLSVEHNKPRIILDEIIMRLHEFDKRFSIHDPGSELMEVNNNAGVKPVKVHPDLYKLIKIGKEHSSADNSYLNIAIGPLVQAWQIGSNEAHRPTPETIQKLLGKINARGIILNDQAQTVFLKQREMFIDLGAIAKGFIADLIIGDLDAMNVSAGLINLGGNVMTYGNAPKHEDNFWRIGIQHPFQVRGTYIAIVKALNQSVVTSGIYERKSIIDNQTYHHILDPNTGYPITTDIASLTVVSKKSIDGEIWTSRLFGQPSEQIINSLEQIKHVEGIVITKNGDLLYSTGIKPYLNQLVT